ncbi:hypothetical protein MJ575_14270 [Klebsiella pneumoniae]|nr:hypothetical protein MJ575_14270 [Klebsiella pneumoniae]
MFTGATDIVASSCATACRRCNECVPTRDLPLTSEAVVISLKNSLPAGGNGRPAGRWRPCAGCRRSCRQFIRNAFHFRQHRAGNVAVDALLAEPGEERGR